MSRRNVREPKEVQMSRPLISTHHLVLVGAVLISVLLVAPWASGAGPPTSTAVSVEARALAPANDNFAAAQLLAGTAGNLVATTDDATKQAGEPAHAGTAGGASIWFRWTADRTGRMTILTRRVSFDTVLAVYTGAALDGLTEVVSNNDTGALNSSRVAFAAVPGTTYYIAVDSFDGVTGPFALRWRQGPQNDDFADASLLEGPAGSVEGTLYGATPEPLEPLHGSGATAWYKWVAPEDGDYGLLVTGAPVVTVYSGASVEALTTLASGTLISFPAVAGNRYSIAVEGSWGDDSGFGLSWGRTPPNDDFGDAEVLQGRSGTVAATDAFATAESDEGIDFGLNTVWYSWTAPRTEDIRFQTRKATLTHDTALSVWTGPSIDSLTLVERNDDFFGLASALSFEATAGTTYYVRVSGFCCETLMGEFDLDWYPGAIIFGTGRSDVINGTSGRDYIVSFDGRDVVHGGGGADVIAGGDDADRLYGEGGNDTLRGGRGSDVLSGGVGNDRLIARDRVRGNDVIFGGRGTDTVESDRGDTIHQVP